MTATRYGEGHLRGGLLLWVLMGAVAQAGCAARGPEPRLPAEVHAVARPLEIYDRLGLVAGTEAFPAVASFGVLAGPADSTYLLFGLSLPTQALRFRRDERGFSAEYVVGLRVLQDSQLIASVLRREPVRVATFEETGRTDESVVFQLPLPLAPGRYVVGVQVQDGQGSRGFETLDTVDVPSFEAGTVAPPVFVYDARGRDARDAAPDLIMNPRHTVPYGGDQPRLYLEGYGVEATRELTVRVVDERGATLWRAGVRLDRGTEAVRYTVVNVPPEILPLGRLWVEVDDGATRERIAREPMVLTISDQWMVANFDDVLGFLTYIAAPAELDSLRDATPEGRHAQWEAFWERRDPVPATPVNEYRETFFRRVRIATDRFTEPGRPGWKTDRGEVYIVLGAPARVYERRVGRMDSSARPNAVEWIYERPAAGDLELLFIDRSGFGQYEMTSASELAFRSAARRLRPAS